MWPTFVGNLVRALVDGTLDLARAGLSARVACAAAALLFTRLRWRRVVRVDRWSGELHVAREVVVGRDAHHVVGWEDAHVSGRSALAAVRGAHHTTDPPAVVAGDTRIA